MSLLCDITSKGVLAGAMYATRCGEWRRFLRAARQPLKCQSNLLRRILADNAQTDFGRRHNFASIADYDTYRRRVPVTTYEGLRPLIERQRATGRPCLTREMPIMYARTSGTTGDSKFIPVSRSGLARLRNTQRLFAHAQFQGSDFYRGKILALASPAIEGRFENGLPYGSATGLMYQSMPKPIQSKYVIPYPLFGIKDYEAKHYAIAALGLQERGITGLATANPSTFLKLLDVIRTQWDRLIEDIARGQSAVSDRLTMEQNDAFTQRLTKNPGRARELEALRRHRNAVSFADIWPNLKGVVTWTGGSCGFALTSLIEQWPRGTKIIEAGYVSSEFWGSINVDIDRSLCVPTILDTFFEFVERSDWENDRRSFLTVNEIEAGRQYYVFVTTPDGLYRYDMNDIIEVTGRMEGTPTISFVQKGKGVTNMTGEKLSEHQVMHAVDLAQKDGHLQIPFFVALADEETTEYQLFVEPLRQNGLTAEAIAHHVDRHLRELNVEYSEKRASGRLKPLRAAWIKPGTGDLYRRKCVANGQRDAQFKYLQLQYKRDCRFDFSRYCFAEA